MAANVKISPNFGFLGQEFPHAVEGATLAERSIHADPRASCFHARHTLEELVKRIYKLDGRLTPPRVTNLDGYLNEPIFVKTVGQTIWQKMEYVRKAGNTAVHGNKAPEPTTALDVMRELYHVLYWAGRTYLRKGAEKLEGVRELVPLLDKTKRHIVFTDFEDQITGVMRDAIIDIPKMTGLEYQRKVEQYLHGHRDNIVIHRLRMNQPLTATDLWELETMLVKIGEADGATLLKGMLAQSQAPSLAHFVRGLVGMDRAAAQAAFSTLLSNESLTPPQIRFVEMIIEQLTARGVIEPGALYEAPFTGLHAGGPDGLFAGKNELITGLFQAIDATQPVFEASAG